MAHAEGREWRLFWGNQVTSHHRTSLNQLIGVQKNMSLIRTGQGDGWGLACWLYRAVRLCFLTGSVVCLRRASLKRSLSFCFARWDGWGLRSVRSAWCCAVFCRCFYSLTYTPRLGWVHCVRMVSGSCFGLLSRLRCKEGWVLGSFGR